MANPGLLSICTLLSDQEIHTLVLNTSAIVFIYCVLSHMPFLMSGLAHLSCFTLLCCLHNLFRATAWSSPECVLFQPTVCYYVLYTHISSVPSLILSQFGLRVEFCMFMLFAGSPVSSHRLKTWQYVDWLC